MKKILVMMLLSVLVLAGCSNNEEEEVQPTTTPTTQETTPEPTEETSKGPTIISNDVVEGESTTIIVENGDFGGGVLTVEVIISTDKMVKDVKVTTTNENTNYDEADLDALAKSFVGKEAFAATADIISGSTVTSDSFLSALQLAFDAYNAK